MAFASGGNNMFTGMVGGLAGGVLGDAHTLPTMSGGGFMPTLFGAGDPSSLGGMPMLPGMPQEMNDAGFNPFAMFGGGFGGGGMGPAPFVNQSQPTHHEQNNWQPALPVMPVNGGQPGVGGAWGIPDMSMMPAMPEIPGMNMNFNVNMNLGGGMPGFPGDWGNPNQSAQLPLNQNWSNNWEIGNGGPIPMSGGMPNDMESGRKPGKGSKKNR